MSPKHGDVVVRQETRDGTVVYILRTAPGTGQFLLYKRDEAVAQAVRFATRHGVQAWLSEHSGDCVLLDAVRGAASACPARERAPGVALRSVAR